MDLADKLLEIMSRVEILPCRLSLSTPGARATVPMLRGVWGAALHGGWRREYDEVFIGDGPENDRTPLYLLRPAPPDPTDSPALEWITLTASGAAHFTNLHGAWRAAADMGLGKRRVPFTIRKMRLIWPDESLRDGGRFHRWPLSMAPWPLKGPPAKTPCRLTFPAPLRLQKEKRLITHPTLGDIVVAAFRRLRTLAEEEQRRSLNDLHERIMGAARQVECQCEEWERLDLVRYSARQKAELNLTGVAGGLDLPSGPGPIWPLLLVAQWTHIGKGTVVGMGQLRISPGQL